MEDLQALMDVLPFLLPIIIIDLGFRIYAIIDIFKPDRKVKGNFNNSKIVWLLVVGLINFGWVIYLLAGKEE